VTGLGTLVAVCIGTLIGLLSGYNGGWFDEIVMRLLDSLMSIPALLFALLMLGMIGPSREGVLLVLVIVYPPIVARVVRSVVLSEKSKSYIASARTQGESTWYILFRQVLPPRCIRPLLWKPLYVSPTPSFSPLHSDFSVSVYSPQARTGA